MNALQLQYARAVDALNAREWARARGAAEELLQSAPNHAGVHFVLGVSALELIDFRVAFRHLMRANDLNPQRADYAAQLARVLMECRMQPQALQQADRALALGSRDPMTLNTLAVIYSRANAHQRAADAFRLAVEALPRQASLHFNLATSLTAIGDIQGAIRECETCIDLDPGFWKAHLTLAQLSKQSPQSNHVERLLALLPNGGGNPEAELYLNLALEKEYEDLGESERAMRHMVAGKRAWKVRLDRSVESDQSLFDAVARACGQLPDSAGGFDSREPIFIFGLPRTGTTLVERIVSSHSRVHSAGELQAFPIAFKRASKVDSRSMLDSATLDAMGNVDWTALGRTYLEGTRPLTGHTPHFIDKLPQNFLYAGLIARALPNAKMICLRRDPMDSCVANFRQLFALSSPSYNYSFDLLDTGRYYLLFDRLMAHWRETMPGRILEIHYEDVVEDQKAATERLLDHCGLEWEEDCINFERNAAPVSTASAVQVRMPIYRTSLQRWKRYGALVGPLRELLVEGGVAVAD